MVYHGLPWFTMVYHIIRFVSEIRVQGVRTLIIHEKTCYHHAATFVQILFQLTYKPVGKKTKSMCHQHIRCIVEITYII